jgi:MFS family permease
MTFGTLSTTIATIAIDVFPDKRKGEILGYFGIIMSLAMVLGPLLVSPLSVTIATNCCLFVVLFLLSLLFFLEA